MWNSDDSTRIIDGSDAVTVFEEFQSRLFVHGGFRLSFNVRKWYEIYDDDSIAKKQTAGERLCIKGLA